MDPGYAALVNDTVWRASAETIGDGTAAGGGERLRRWVLTPVDYPGFNGVFEPEIGGTGPDSVRAWVTEAMAPFEDAALPMLWHLDVDRVDATLVKTLLDRGLTHYETEPGMIVDLADRRVPPVPTPPGLSIVEPSDPAGITAWTQVWSGERGTSLVAAASRVRLARATAPKRPTRHLLGVLNGEPVACAAVYLGADAALVEHVVTAEHARGRGLGTAITSAALDLAREHGLSWAVLTSSPDGLRVYRSLGFRQVCEVTRYLWEPARRCSST